MKKGKKFKEALKQLDQNKVYNIDEGLQTVLSVASCNFDESIDLAIKLGVDPKQADQQVRGAVVLPFGLGKKIRVLVFAKGEKEIEAQKAEADFVGGKDLVDKILSGWLDFDRVLSTPDMMPVVAKAAKVLGPRGLMPSPKTGTVTPRIGPLISTEKKGRAFFRVEKNAIIHSSIGRKSMGLEKLKKNSLTLTGEIIKLKPKSSKGVYLQAVYVSSTMGPSLRLNPTQIQQEAI